MIIIIILACCSALFYRIGGMSKEEARDKLPWVPSFLVRSFTRDLGCTLIIMTWVYFFLPQIDDKRLYFYSAVAMYASLTTYWDRWPGNKGEDNFFMHGLFIGLSLLPIAYGTGLWFELIVRSVVMGIAMAIVCTATSNVDIEEYGRGWIIGGSLLILTSGIF